MERFQLSLDPIIIKAFKKTNLLPLISPVEDTNTQSCIVATQTTKGGKLEENEVIAGASIDPEDVVVIRKSDRMVVMREKGNVRASRNLLPRAASYDIVRHSTVLPLHFP